VERELEGAERDEGAQRWLRSAVVEGVGLVVDKEDVVV
jgi:hypothetical protein